MYSTLVHCYTVTGSIGERHTCVRPRDKACCVHNPLPPILIMDGAVISS